MVNTQMIKDIIKEKGIKKGKIKDYLGISYNWLNKKLNGQQDFKAEEIMKICEILDIKDLELKEKIFFTPSVDKMPTDK